MSHRRSSFWRCSTTFRLVEGSCMVLLYLLTATPLSPLLMMLLAMTDSSHHAVIGQTSSGTQVVLRHDCYHSPTHRHGIVARAITLVAQRPAEGNPDHVIQFADSPISEQLSTLAVTPVSDSSAHNFHLLSNLLSPQAFLIVEPAVLPRPPTAANSLLTSIRSTVLRI